MKPAPCLVTLSIAALLTGCATGDFTPYSGAQQNWPTAPGAFVKTQYAVPAYYGLPPRPYVVLGYLDADTAPIRRKGVVEFAAKRAKEIGGDAIIVQSVGSEYAGTYSTGSASTTTNYSGNVVATPVGQNVFGTVRGTGYSTTNSWGWAFLCSEARRRW